MLSYEGRGMLPYEGRGMLPYEGRGILPYEGRGMLPYEDFSFKIVLLFCTYELFVTSFFLYNFLNVC